MSRTAASLAASIVIAGCVCCAGSAPTPSTPASVVEIAPSSAETAPPAPALVLAADERLLVQCGVDDTPKSVVGEAAPVGIRDGSLGVLLKPRFVPDLLEPMPPSAGARAPMRRTDLVVPLAPSEARVTFVRASRSRHPLAPALGSLLTNRSFDVERCLGAKPIPRGEIGFRIRVASSGVPVAAALLTSSLDDDVNRCVVETACRLALPAGEAVDDLEIVATLAPVAPAYKGVVKASATTDVPANASAKQRAALERIVAIVRPMAQACAEKSPPAANFLLPLRLTVFANRLGSQTPAMGGAVFDISQCFVPKIGEAVGPLDPSLRREKFIRLEIGFQGQEP